MEKYLAECYPEGESCFRGIVLRETHDGMLLVFNLTTDEKEFLHSWEVDTPIYNLENEKVRMTTGTLS